MTVGCAHYCFLLVELDPCCEHGPFLFVHLECAYSLPSHIAQHEVGGVGVNGHYSGVLRDNPNSASIRDLIDGPDGPSGALLVRCTVCKERCWEPVPGCRCLSWEECVDEGFEDIADLSDTEQELGAAAEEMDLQPDPEGPQEEKPPQQQQQQPQNDSDPEVITLDDGSSPSSSNS